MPTLHWLTKDEDVKAASKVPYRLLEEVPELGAGDRSLGNMIVQGDNLEALKSLLPFYRGQVKCIYIDPPYNTKSAFEHYDDNLEHSQWLAMIYPRLELLRDLLSEDGSIWVSIDDNEGHYLKVVMDEVFGRKNFVANVVWQKKYSPQNDAKWLSDNHDHILVTAKDKEKWRPNLLPRSEDMNARYRNPDDDARGPWKPSDFSVKTFSKEGDYPIQTPSGRIVKPPQSRSWGSPQSTFFELIADNRIWFGENGSNVPALKKFLSEVKDGVTAMTIWPYEDVGHNQDAKKEIKAFADENTFSTPKPEKLIKQILTLGSLPNDLVLDSFLGSGTTAAVAQKMGRRYIGIEMGMHAVTHCRPRIAKVVDGEQGGISQSVNWKGGGGFRFYRLGAPVFDPAGHISADIRFPVLAAHIWFSETGTPWDATLGTPYIGTFDGKAYALLYNGILGDKSVSGGNVLTRQTLSLIRTKSGDVPLTIYGERSALGAASLARENITFKQTPYDVKARA